jgi:hypothetical protein
MRRHRINQLNNFISGWYMDDTSLCDDIINLHTTSDKKSPGVYGAPNLISDDGLSELVVDKTIKDSIDCLLMNDLHLYERYISHLQSVIILYSEQYPRAADYGYFANDSLVNIQYYPPRGGYHSWHTERNSNIKPICDRHLVFMTYLNDVDDAGETEFWHQMIKVKPEKGLTLIWPTDWTFTHRGVSSMTQDKYIVTGWMNYITKPMGENNGT